MSDIGLFEAMYSARALRRLKPDPVPEEILTRILDAAIRAPSAGNAQNWAFIVVRDLELRRRLGRRLPQGLRHRERDVRGARASRSHDRRPVSQDALGGRVPLGPHG